MHRFLTEGRQKEGTKKRVEDQKRRWGEEAKRRIEIKRFTVAPINDV